MNEHQKKELCGWYHFVVNQQRRSSGMGGSGCTWVPSLRGLLDALGLLEFDCKYVMFWSYFYFKFIYIHGVTLMAYPHLVFRLWMNGVPLPPPLICLHCAHRRTFFRYLWPCMIPCCNYILYLIIKNLSTVMKFWFFQNCVNIKVFATWIVNNRHVSIANMI